MNISGCDHVGALLVLESMHAIGEDGSKNGEENMHNSIK
jgi:hypothetical protein